MDKELSKTQIRRLKEKQECEKKQEMISKLSAASQALAESNACMEKIKHEHRTSKNDEASSSEKS
jgi:hypothetical protein